MDPESISIRRPCGETITVNRESAGQVFVCLSCKAKLRVPAQSQNEDTAPSKTLDTSTPSSFAKQQPASGLGSSVDSAQEDRNSSTSQPIDNLFTAPNVASPNPVDSENALNPYAPTSAVSTLDENVDINEAMRSKYLDHEASLKSIGLLQYVSALALLSLGIMLTAALRDQFVFLSESLLLLLTIYAFAIGQYLIGRGMRRLQNWARVTTGILAIPGLFGIPIGTVISAYVLYVCFSDKGVYITSSKYHEVVANTPHMRRKNSAIMLVFVGLLLLFGSITALAVIFG